MSTLPENELKQQILRLHAEGMSNRKIAAHLDTNHVAVGRVVAASKDACSTDVEQDESGTSDGGTDGGTPNVEQAALVADEGWTIDGWELHPRIPGPAFNQAHNKTSKVCVRQPDGSHKMVDR